jgi:hypothetical protein
LTRQVVGTNVTTDIFGKAPRGFLSYGRDGRMMALVVKDERPRPADLAKMTDDERASLFRTMIAYGGTFTFDGRTVTHHVVISWNQNWTGSNQVRNVAFDGSRLIISTNPQQSSIDGKTAVSLLVWEKVRE